MKRSSATKVQNADQTAYMKTLYSLRSISPEDSEAKRKENKATILGYD